MQWLEPEIKQTINKKFMEKINELKENSQPSNKNFQANPITNGINIIPNVESSTVNIKEQTHNNPNILSSSKPNQFNASGIAQFAKKIKKILLTTVRGYDQKY